MLESKSELKKADRSGVPDSVRYLLNNDLSERTTPEEKGAITVETRKADFLLAAYAAHKEELSFRRRGETYVTGFVMLFFISNIAFVLLNTSVQNSLSSLFSKAIITLVYILFANVVAYYLYKNYKRHCELQRIIVDIDRAFGFFDKDAYITDRSLYPEEWQNAGTWRDFSLYSRCAIALSFTLMAIITIWVKAF